MLQMPTPHLLPGTRIFMIFHPKIKRYVLIPMLFAAGVLSGISTYAIVSYVAQHACNTTSIPLQGYLSVSGQYMDTPVSTSQEITALLESAYRDEKIKAIILDIDSGGGLPVAGEEIANTLKNSPKPTAVLIHQSGASAAYWAASGGQRIFASANSDVGSIGVVYSYLDNTKKNATEGLTYNQVSSGKFKTLGDPNKPLSEEERKLLMRNVQVIYQNFVEAVSANRKLDLDKVEKLADGSTMLGTMALENGLIDEIGGVYEVKSYLKGRIGEEPIICNF
jgi:protease-4